MTDRRVVALPGNEPLADALAASTGAGRIPLETRRLPDGETYLRFDGDPAGAEAVLVCTLDRPDGKILPLMFAAATARELGAQAVGLVAPYLAYMRQDRRFQPGEAVTSTHFARLLSCAFDWLVTVDPHLHRHAALAELYDVPAAVLHAAPVLAEWISREVANPLLVGPDSESAQWVGEVARMAAAPHVVLEKTRRGDRDVEVSVPETGRWTGHTPVLVDDIVSSGATMMETIGHLRAAGLRPPVCVAIHGIFADNAYADLLAAGAARVVSSNTIRHPANAIDVTPLLAEGLTRISGVVAQPEGEQP